MVKIAFRYADKRIFARLVCLWRGGDSAHCEVVEETSQPGVYTCLSASWLDGGVRIKRMSLPASKWRVYTVHSTEDIYPWAARNVGKKYDWFGLLGFVLPRIRGKKQSYFCSEVGAEIIGLREPYKFDLRLLESVCARYGERIQ